MRDVGAPRACIFGLVHVRRCRVADVVGGRGAPQDIQPDTLSLDTMSARTRMCCCRRPRHTLVAEERVLVYVHTLDRARPALDARSLYNVSPTLVPSSARVFVELPREPERTLSSVAPHPRSVTTPHGHDTPCTRIVNDAGGGLGAAVKGGRAHLIDSSHLAQRKSGSAQRQSESTVGARADTSVFPRTRVPRAPLAAALPPHLVSATGAPLHSPRTPSCSANAVIAPAPTPRANGRLRGHSSSVRIDPRARIPAHVTATSVARERSAVAPLRMRMRPTACVRSKQEGSASARGEGAD
ncbi:hypothetical protein DFH09DRAFT_1333115 [Mycena vulgaris]|nr:hypothetical protein DFH09DRAFT_1333115 [Mycena vulgaris]